MSKPLLSSSFSIWASFFKSSLLRLRLRAQSKRLQQPSTSDFESDGPAIISIRRTRSEKLLSLKAKPKFPSFGDLSYSESITVLGSNKSLFIFFILFLQSIFQSIWGKFQILIDCLIWCNCVNPKELGFVLTFYLYLKFSGFGFVEEEGEEEDVFFICLLLSSLSL